MSGEKEAIGEDRAVRIGWVLDSFLSRREAGESVSEAELCTRHPDIALELRMHLDLLGDLPPAVDKINTLIAKGLLARSEDPKYQAQLGAYKIHDYIGRGGMGIVLKAYEESLNRTVALKILRPELADDHVALERFTREAKAAAALKHPNIVTVHAIGHERGVPFIAMEYVEGPSLAEVIRSVGSPCPTDAANSVGSPCSTDLEDELDARGSSLLLSSSHSSSGSRFPLTTEAIRHIFGQLLEALAAAHDAGLIHRDVKSSNILLTSSSSVPQQPRATVPCDPEPRTLNPEPSIKLADFGLARMLNSQTRMTAADSILGTPEYMSPEQARGDSEIDHRTDLYSAGVVLYEMLTGRVPFKADTPSAVIHQILNTDPPEPRTFNQEVDPVLASLALRLMAKEREDRLASADAAIEVLEAGRPVASLEAHRRLRRRIMTAASGVVLIGGGVWLVSQLISRSRPDTGARVSEVEKTIRSVQIDERRKWILLAYYGDDAEPKVFHDFSPDIDRIRDAKLVDLDGHGERIVVAGLNKPVGGQNLIALDAQGKELWRQDVSNVAPDYLWPDCGPPAHWSCYMVIVGNLGGRAGDELVVVAKDTDSYPTRISRIDARSGQVVSTFWHMGQLEDVKIARDFFGPKQPAIIAWGTNNKLDGFGDPYPPWPYKLEPDEDPPKTRYDHVNIAMVLDPDNMDGRGPPRTRRLDMEHFGAARPFAYAFLDRPMGKPTGSYVPEGGTERRFPTQQELGSIGRIEVPARADMGGDGHSITVYLDSPTTEVGGARLAVDRNLNVRKVEFVTGSGLYITEDYWREHWHPIIQNGAYVDR